MLAPLSTIVTVSVPRNTVVVPSSDAICAALICSSVLLGWMMSMPWAAATASWNALMPSMFASLSFSVTVSLSARRIEFSPHTLATLSE